MPFFYTIVNKQLAKFGLRISVRHNRKKHRWLSSMSLILSISVEQSHDVGEILTVFSPGI